MKLTIAAVVSRALWMAQGIAFRMRLYWIGARFVNGACAVRDWAGMDWIFDERYRMGAAD